MEQIPTFLLQGGGLGIFAWYAWQNNREWRAFLTERNSKLEKALDKQSITTEAFTKALGELSKVIARTHRK